MAMPFYQSVGFSKIEVAEIANFYGLWMAIIGGLFAGLTLFKFGLVKNMVFGAIFVPLANLPFIYLNSVIYSHKFSMCNRCASNIVHTRFFMCATATTCSAHTQCQTSSACPAFVC